MEVEEIIIIEAVEEIMIDIIMDNKDVMVKTIIIENQIIEGCNVVFKK